MLDLITSDVLAREPGLLKRPSRMRYIALPGSPEGRTTTFLAFADDRSRPAFVVKIFREPEDRQRAENEAAILRFLARTTLAASVPRVLSVIDIDGLAAIAQTHVPGRPMRARMAGGVPDTVDAGRNIARALDWLSSLSQVSVAAEPHAAREHALRALEVCAEVFQLDPAERDYVRSLTDAVRKLGIGATICHGDFTRHNILVDRERLRIIDWSDSRGSGLPLHDVFAFVTSYYLQLRPHHGLAGFLEAFDATFLVPNPFSVLVMDRIRHQCELGGIDRASSETLLATFLAERAVFEHEQVAQSARRGSLPRSTLAFAAEVGAELSQALISQYWIHFFRRLVARRSQLLIAH